MYLVTWIIVFVIILVIGWWVLSGYNLFQPSADRPDVNATAIINEFNSFRLELWFRNDPCIFKEKLAGSCRRYVVLESDGTVIYDSRPGMNRILPADDIPRTVEYQRASVTFQGVVLRGKTANVCMAVYQGARFRMVHISEYLFDEQDPQF